MDGVNGHMVPPALWQEARNADGRVYYYNTITKVTQWDKPVELMTPVERALADQPWKEYTAEGGRKYWYNTETKQSIWEMPAVYKEALEKQEPPAAPVAAAPTFVAGGGFSDQYDRRDRERDRDYDRRDRGSRRSRSPIGESRQIAYGNDANGSRAQVFIPASTDPEYSTFEEAESAFMKLLRRSGVKPDWTWEQAMRTVIKDPQYRALKDPKDRKAAFEKFVVEIRLEEKDRAKERLAKLKTDFTTMLKSHPEIKYYTRWKTAKPIIEGETIFRSTDDDNERRQLFEDYIVELRNQHAEQEANKRKSAIEELAHILKDLSLEPYTRWSEAQGIIQESERIKGDEKFEVLTKSDMLTAFENHIKSLERTFNDVRQQQKSREARKFRQNRDRFVDLLNELRRAGKIKAGSKWSEVYPLFESDERYQNILGQPGSTPLDLFWDIVEEAERALRSIRNDVLDVLDDKRFEIQEKTTFEEFLALMQKDRRTANIDRDSLRLIFDRLHEKVLRRFEDDKHQAERKQRRAVDDLRSYIKHLEPSIKIDDTFEKIRPRIERSEEYMALPTDELRRAAFEKVIRRLKEKEEDFEKERLRRKEREGSSRLDYRDRRDSRDIRDRGERHHRDSRHRPSRSPEPDAYEADRRKAIADREKNYRGKSNVADTLLSPSRRSMDRRSVDRDHLDRGHRSRRDEPMDRYEMEVRARREREDERERLYRRRGDPRGQIDELPYGDEKPAPVPTRRRRADSELESLGSKRDTKRTRRELTPVAEKESSSSKPPSSIAAETGKEDPAVHSGSEEGEIEEE